jgi:maltose O-acetyltransferase
MKKIFRRFTAVILEFEVMLLGWIGNIPSHHIRRFFYRIAGITIGSGSTIHMGAIFYNPKNISLGKDSVLGEDIVLDGRDVLTIGNHVDIASEVMIYNSQHDIHDPNFQAVNKPVMIGDYVFVGPRSIILPGVTLHKGSVVAAGAVVTKDVSEFTVVGGVPAQKIGDRTLKNPHYKLGRAAWFR